MWKEPNRFSRNKTIILEIKNSWRGYWLDIIEKKSAKWNTDGNYAKKAGVKGIKCKGDLRDWRQRSSNICLIGISERHNKENMLETIVQEIMAKSLQLFFKNPLILRFG